MTPEEKIAALVEHIKKEFPKGCRDVQDCADCPLDGSEYGTYEEAICEMLSIIENHVAWDIAVTNMRSKHR
jgi:hypothetical protein